jgi:hypothetical protein
LICRDPATQHLDNDQGGGNRADEGVAFQEESKAQPKTLSL